jgi:hypothetical protein
LQKLGIQFNAAALGGSFIVPNDLRKLYAQEKRLLKWLKGNPSDPSLQDKYKELKAVRDLIDKYPR